MGVCTTTLKRACRVAGITRWPSRKLKKLDGLNRSVEQLSTEISFVPKREGEQDPGNDRLQKRPRSQGDFSAEEKDMDFSDLDTTTQTHSVGGPNSETKLTNRNDSRLEGTVASSGKAGSLWQWLDGIPNLEEFGHTTAPGTENYEAAHGRHLMRKNQKVHGGNVAGEILHGVVATSDPGRGHRVSS